ncbi:hypothetical protein GCM10027022_09430 [Alpinimonas psychrophila]|uniref:Tetratricopeptide repeat protein n=1 Tax=Alpinimonas psychrophila TaxID=748908 RepID=A0A7W3PNT6_9MICO|nr:hypothetical protein [Alpinimonas psychrophila]MBA8828765.1 hypothetical protein [Alpinimonas psychrophila]
MTRAVIGSVFMAILLVLYMWVAGYQAFIMMSSGNGVVIAMGIALLVLPLIGVWALIRELSFGIRSGRLIKRLQAENGLPEDTLAHRPSGRTIRESADEEFPLYAAEVEATPESWRAWMRLGLAYDASGDRRRARSAVRTAIAFSKMHPA